ncbi:MAG TPA: alpha/beta hydrolase [Myxococcales bacterium]|jgi:pimeloyl-ACP methyl ester carboxylesterase|nr:alpha/beta hydrolase [Myxococcales bacterium]
MRLEQWKRSGLDYDHRGYHVFYRDQGQGPALLFIHGFPTASYDFAPLWEPLAQRFRCVAADMLGFGFSSKPRPYGYGIADQAELFEGLCRHLRLDEVHVLAHDYGDTVAQELLARFEGRRERGQRGTAIRSACFLNGGLFPERHRPRFAQRLLASPLGPWLARRFDEARFSRAMRGILAKETQPTEEAMHELWELVLHNDGRAVMPLLIGYMKERRRHRARWVGALLRTGVPLRFICGADDPVSGRHMARRYLRLVPRPDVVLLERTGHYPQLERPGEVLAAYLDFAERVAGRSPAADRAAEPR